MYRLSPTVALILLLGACGSREERAAEPARAENRASPAAPPASDPSAVPAAARWKLETSGEGSALVLAPASGAAAIRLFCPARGKSLLVNVPAFRPIGSEERLSFGSGESVVALVADTRGDAARGGVSGTGAVPAELAGLLEGSVAASYGAQTSGPHPAPPPELVRSFAAACGQSAAPEPAPTVRPIGDNPCLIHEGKPLPVKPLHAVGTEPFWSARIEGRCVTYSHPEDQKGTRIWTRFSPGADGGGTWSGALGGRRFELRTRPEPDCSDGMSDRRYPLGVELVVGGERRLGCAQPI